MTSRLAELVGIPTHSVVDVYLQGPNGIHIFLTDQVVANLKDESMFSVEIINGNRFHFCTEINTKMVVLCFSRFVWRKLSPFAQVHKPSAVKHL
jgi:hypothetical protein